MGVRQMATLEVRGLGLSCVLPFWPLWLTIPAQAGVPSSWRGGIFHKLHFYLKENKGPASWCLDPRPPPPLTWTCPFHSPKKNKIPSRRGKCWVS